MTNRYRCVFVSQRFPPDKGGNAARIHDITTHLKGQEWDITVLSPPPSYPPGEFDRTWERKRTETTDGVTVHRLLTWQPQVENPGTIQRLAYYLLFGIHTMIWLLWNVRRYDAVVTSTPPISTGAPGLLASLLGKPWVVDVRDLWIDASISLGYLEKGSLLERVSRRFQWLVLRSADRIVVTTEALGDSLFGAYGWSLAEKTVHLPNGVDTERFYPARDRETEHGGRTTETPQGRVTEVGDGERSVALGADTESGGGHPVIIYTGNLGAAQDLESCIRAMDYLSNESAILYIVGSGDVETNLKRLADAHGLDSRVVFEGVVPREEVPPLLRKADVGIAPLRDTEKLAYAMPTKVYEYMASGLPTLVTGRGEVERFIDESGGGVSAENDPEHIATLLDELLADKEYRERLAENGREYVQERYDRRVIAQQLRAELLEIVEET